MIRFFICNLLLVLALLPVKVVRVKWCIELLEVSIIRREQEIAVVRFSSSVFIVRVNFLYLQTRTSISSCLNDTFFILEYSRYFIYSKLLLQKCKIKFRGA